MVTGIGGVFIKAKDPKKLAEWYQTNLGIGFGGSSYVTFKWVNENHPTAPGTTAFALVKEKEASNVAEKQAAVNFRVKDIEALIEQLRSAGVQTSETIDSYDFGKFGWCIDPEDNKIELWEPIDG